MSTPRRRALGAALVVLALAGGTPFAIAAFDTAGYDRAAGTILCDCGCHPQSVAECTCGRAAEMREEIRGMIAGGMSGDAVIASYVERYGEKIRIAPEATGFNLLAWVGPLVLLVVGVAALVLVVRRWSRTSATDAAAAPTFHADDDPYLARLRREIEERR